MGCIGPAEGGLKESAYTGIEICAWFHQAARQREDEEQTKDNKAKDKVT